MLAKRYRLPSDLLTHFSGAKSSGPTLMVIVSPSSLTHDRLATIISNKVFPHAHDRHALKRLLHETLRPYVDEPPHFDLLIIAHAQKTHPALAAYAVDLTRILNILKSKI